MTDVQGTVNLLSSVAKAGKSVKRVVLTSSVAAMTPLSMSNGKGANNN
jgi:nucleoside-diphosphate-sugar epimerase